MSYDKNIIHQVQSAIDIVDVISQYVPLKRSGKNFKGLSPFKQEKTPSFFVNPEKQMFYCFSSGTGGDVFSFLMKYENMSFPEALKMLAERANITLPEQSFKREQGSSNDVEQIYKVYEASAQFYQEQLKSHPTAKIAREYLKKRGLDQVAIDEFRMGWAPAGWQNLFVYLGKKGFSDKLMLKAGVVKQSDKGRLYDVFRERVLFPIQNLQGKVVGFGGRVFSEESTPKYLNSSENPVFKKGKELFGLNFAKKHIDQHKPTLIVVEGYMDFFRLYLAGFKNTVATLGTAMTADHVRLMKRFVQEVIVIYDGDSAGQSAALRGSEIFLEEGLSVKLILMPEGEDPDDFVEKHGKVAFQAELDKAMDFFDFKLQLAKRKHDLNDAVSVVKVTNDFLETLAKINNMILLEHYIRKLANELHLDDRSLRQEVQKFKDRQNKSAANSFSGDKKEAVEAKGESKLKKEEVLLVGLLLQKPDFIYSLVNSLDDVGMHSALFQDIFAAMKENVHSVEEAREFRVFNYISDNAAKSQLAQQVTVEWEKEKLDQAFQDCMEKIRQNGVNARLTYLQTQIGEAEKKGDHKAVLGLMQEYQALIRQRQSVSK